MSDETKNLREEAERLLREGPASAPVGIAYALLAIHDELQAIRRHIVPPPGPHKSMTSTVHG